MGLLINPYRFAAAGGGGSSYDAEVTADSPGIWFRLQEAITNTGTVQDETAGNYDGTVTFGSGAGDKQSTDTPIASDATARSAAWTHANDRIATTYNPGSITDLTLECWIKTTTTSGWLMTTRGATSGIMLGIGTFAAGGTGKPWLGVNGSGLARGAYGSVAVNDGTWHHIVGVWDGTAGVQVGTSQFTIYVDGVAQSMTADNTAGVTPTPPLTVSDLLICRSSSGEGGIVGNFAEPALYTSALSSARIAAHFAAA